MRGTDAAIHLAGMYRVGIPASERPAMHDANVGATHRVLDAFATAGLDRLVAISTINVAGNTHGRIVDERYRRDLTEGFLSYYDETKFLAHRAVQERIGAGCPDRDRDARHDLRPERPFGHRPAARGRLRRHAARTWSLADLGISPVYVDDVAAGIVAALDRGRIGESYFLGGQNMRLRDAMADGRPARRPDAAAPRDPDRHASDSERGLRRRWHASMGLPDDLGEVLRSALGVTFWGSSAKAATELGYAPRDLASGLRATFDGR